MRTLKHRRVLITGAGSGLGRELALCFAAAGWKVACTDVRPQAAEDTLAQIRQQQGDGLAAALDVRSEAGFAAVVEQLDAQWDGFDVLINNAGVATAGTVADSPLEQWQWVLDINLLGCVRGARAAVPVLRRQGGGHIVNVASFAGIANPPALASYNVAKAGVIALSETLRFELDPDRIGVSVACPSFFQTDLLNSGDADAPESRSTAPQMTAITGKLMHNAQVTAGDVARDILHAVETDRFMVISHPDARSRHRLKRFAPELYFRLARRATAAFLKR
ncbi:MAG: SDR family oxidoreductase [Nevskiales bacterium]|nr:SDR family oxidoreductase [Nevskiales bacterium]